MFTRKIRVILPLPVAVALALHILDRLIVEVAPAPRQDDVNVPPRVSPHKLLGDVITDLRVAAIIRHLCVIVPASDLVIKAHDVFR